MTKDAAASVEIIAEVSTNHGGDMQLAKEFIRRCAEAGATFVKFQHTRVKHLRPDDPQYAWFQRAELSLEQFAELKAECDMAGVKFLTTVYNAQDVPEVEGLCLEAIKVGSGEARELALARAVAAFPRVIVGLGLAGKPALTPFRHMSQAVFLRSVSRYPTPLLAAMEAAKPYLNTHGRVVGWSDHCVGIDAACAAICAGATIIEKHVQLNHQARPCQPWEATIQELCELRRCADDNPGSKYIGRWQHA